MNLAPLFEAITITAVAKVRWPELDMAIAKPLVVDRHTIMLPEWIARDRLEASLALAAFCEERIDLDKLWTGIRYVWLGYGPRTNTLVVSYH